MQKEPKEIKKENDRKKTDDNEKNSMIRKDWNNFGRKKIRGKVTIVTALSETDERTRSLTAYKRAKQKTKK